MARILSFLLGLIFLISLTARTQDKVELFGGYSFERFRAPPSFNLNGWEISGQYKFANWLGGVADLDAHYGSPSQIDRTVSFMVGPQVSLPAPISPFFHALVGVGHIRAGGIADSSLSTALGGESTCGLLPKFRGESSRLTTWLRAFLEARNITRAFPPESFSGSDDGQSMGMIPMFPTAWWQ